MADTTSVGVIQLDVEINPKSLNLEMDKLGKAFNNSFKNMFSGMVRQNNNFIKESISNIGKSFRNFGQTGLGASEKVSKSVSKMNAEYEKTEAKISKIRSELEQLFAAQDVIVRSYQDFPALSGLTKDETIEQLLKSDPKFNELSTQIDKLISELDPLVAKNKELANEIENVGDKADDAGNKFNKMGNSAKKAGKSIFNLSWLKRMFTNESKNATNAASNFGNTMSRVSRMIARNLIVYGLIIKGLKGMIDYMWSALKTNQQFAHSLNVIRTNLLVAFQPIYSFVLPALNALMQAVATVTTYIASAISALFGKTYKQSFNSAKAMNKQIEAMEGLGKAAGGAGKKAKKAGKDAKGALMAFDEINQLDIKDDRDDSGGAGGGAGGFEMEMPDLATIDISGIERFKEIMGQIFEPFKKAWENEGQNTINSIKYALNEIKELIKAIGRSWLEVWTNGTGQAILETMLRILQNIFNTIGDIAQSFTKAWVEGGRGTSIMQHIHNIILHILTLVERLTGAFREAWGEVGNTLARAFLETLDNILATLDHLGGKLVWVWDNGGEHLFQGFVRLGAKIAELVMFILNEFVLPFVNWFIDLMAPAVAKLCDWIGKLFDTFSKFIDWLMGDGYPVLETVVTILGSMALAFGIVKGTVAIYNGIMTIATAISTGFGAVMAFITSPIGLVTIAIGAVIAITTALYRNWDTVGPWLKETWQGIKDKAEEIWNGIADFFVELWEGITTALTEAWNAIVEFLVGLWEGLSESVTEIWTAISEFISETWDSIKTKTSEIWNAIKTFLVETIWNPIKTAAQTIWNGIKKVILDPINQAWTSLKETWDKIKKYILDKWNEIKQGIADMKDKLVNAIMKPFKIADEKIHGIIGDAKNWGRNLIQNFIDGINAMIGKVKDAVSNVANTVKDFLGFSSPTKKGPGSKADKWMPNFMEMMADGIEDNLYEVSAAVNLTAGTIKQGIQPNTDDMASAVGSAVLQSMQMVGNNQGQESGDIILQIDGITVGRILGPIMDREKERIGEPVIKPI